MIPLCVYVDFMLEITETILNLHALQIATPFDKWQLSYKFLYLGVLHRQLNFHLEIWNHSGGQAKTSFLTIEFLHISSNEVCLILRIFFSFHFRFFFVSIFYHLNHKWKGKTMKYVMDIDCYNLFPKKKHHFKLYSISTRRRPFPLAYDALLVSSNSLSEAWRKDRNLVPQSFGCNIKSTFHWMPLCSQKCMHLILITHHTTKIFRVDSENQKSELLICIA